jgi:hypothetical protein
MLEKRWRPPDTGKWGKGGKVGKDGKKANKGGR